MNILADIYRSIFRGDAPGTEKGKTELVFYNVWLHIHPAKVQKEHLRVTHTWYLGLISFFLFLILSVTGVALMFYYVPYPARAYQDMKDLAVRGLRGPSCATCTAGPPTAWSWSSSCTCAASSTRAPTRRPREFNWVVGVVLLLLHAASQLHRLPAAVGPAGLLGHHRGHGHRRLRAGRRQRRSGSSCSGGHTVGQEALLRFYVLHVVVLPGVLALLTMVHFWRIRKDGGLSRPRGSSTRTRRPRARRRGRGEPREDLRPHGGGHGQAPVRGPHARPGGGRRLLLPLRLLPRGIAFLLTSAAVMVVSLFFGAPLEELANPAKTPNPAKAPWYFLGLQELVSYSAFWGGCSSRGSSWWLSWRSLTWTRTRAGSSASGRAWSGSSPSSPWPTWS